MTRQTLPISQGRIKALTKRILRELKISHTLSLGIAFLSDKEIKTLNLKHLKRNMPTDVLTFDYQQNIADIAISLETVKRNASLYRTTCAKELLRCIVHGILHLAGYDDRNPKDKKRMFRKQEEICKKIVTSDQSAPASPAGEGK